MSTEEEIIRQARDTDTTYVSGKRAREERLKQEERHPHSLAEFMRNLKPKNRPRRLPPDQQTGEGCFLRKRS